MTNTISLSHKFGENWRKQMKWRPNWSSRIKQNDLNCLSSSESCIRSGLSTFEIVLLVELNCRHVKRKGQNRGPIKKWVDKQGNEWMQWCVKWERAQTDLTRWLKAMTGWKKKKKKRERKLESLKIKYSKMFWHDKEWLLLKHLTYHYFCFP